MTNQLAVALRHALTENLSAARSLRRVMHSVPQLSGDERHTTRTVLAHLPGGCRVEHVAGTGAVVRIGGAGPAIAVRAELDALPIMEQTGVEWASANSAMHACGHDVHLAAAVALACAVHATPSAVPMLLVLQPREETLPSGALDVIDSGALTPGETIAVLGAHVQPLIEPGLIACTPGAVNASADEFTVVMHGRGGHAAYPHLGADPLLAVAQFVVAAQQLVARETDPMSAAVVSVGSVHGGSSPNVRPDSASARGTVRAMSAAHRSLLLKRLETIAGGVATACGCEVDVTVEMGEPVLANDESLARRAGSYLGELGLVPSAELRSCGADDFAYYGEHFPALMMFVGTGVKSGNLHSPAYLPDDTAVDHTALALLAGYLAAAHGAAGESSNSL